MARRKKLRGGFTRRQFLAGAAKTAVAGAAIGSMPSLVPKIGAALPGPWALDDGERETLRAALARIIPADGPGDWSAVDAGADTYIERLLSGDNVIYAGGNPIAPDAFQDMSRVKEFGWDAEITRLRSVYRGGLADLNTRSGGSFADVSPAEQEAILRRIDAEGSAFFAALYDHTMEGVYAHPAYGGNTNRIAWKSFAYEGDVHGRRFPAESGPWQTYGGYSPTEMAQPGDMEGS